MRRAVFLPHIGQIAAYPDITTTITPSFSIKKAYNPKTICLPQNQSSSARNDLIFLPKAAASEKTDPASPR